MLPPAAGRSTAVIHSPALGEVGIFGGEGVWGDLGGAGKGEGVGRIGNRFRWLDPLLVPTRGVSSPVLGLNAAVLLEFYQPQLQARNER